MKLSSDLVIRHIAGEVLLIPTGKAACDNPGLITLTPSGELLVKRLLEGAEVDDLVDCLLSEYEVEQERAKADVLLFLGKLKERGLL